jgi:hypothetical protein
MKLLFASLLACVIAFAAVPAPAEAKPGKKVMVIKTGHHDRGLHRGWSHSKHWGARKKAVRTRVIIRH